MTATNATADREIVTIRVLAAPPELVFAAWTDPAHISNWWGPHGFTTTTRSFDLRPGGTWRFTMHGPDGVNYENEIVYVEIDAPRRLVYRHSGAEATEDVRFHTTVSFDPVDGGTRVTLRATFETAAERERVAREYGAVEGAEQTLDRLGAFLAGR